MDKLRYADVGSQIIVTIKDSETGLALDISTATYIEFNFQLPDGTTILTVEGDFVTDGSDGKVVYITETGDLNQIGIWRYQVYVTLPAGVLHSELGRIKVEDIIRR